MIIRIFHVLKWFYIDYFMFKLVKHVEIMVVWEVRRPPEGGKFGGWGVWGVEPGVRSASTPPRRSLGVGLDPPEGGKKLRLVEKSSTQRGEKEVRPSPWGGPSLPPGEETSAVRPGRATASLLTHCMI